MKYRTLGKTGLKVSVIGVGTWQLGGEWGKNFTQLEADAILNRARELGINLIDTAECYGDHLSEILVGNAIKKNRKDWILATKFGHSFGGHLQRESHWSPAEVLSQLDASLKALQTDYIDLYQFHSGDNMAFHQQDLWEALQKQVKAGKIRHLGNSLSNDFLTQTKESTQFGVEVVQVIYNRLDRRPEEEVFPAAKEQNLGVLARVPLASGFLSGKYKVDSKFSENDVRARYDKNFLKKRLKEAEEIQRTEVPAGVNMAQWALAWCLGNPLVTAVIPGCKNPTQVESNAKTVDLLN